MIDLRQDSKYANYIKALGWITDKAGKNHVFVKKILFTSIVKIQRPNAVFGGSELHRLVGKYKPFVVYVEPKDTGQENYFIKSLGFKQSKVTLLPSKTIKIDLGKSDEALLKAMHYKTRYNIKKSQKLGIKTGKSKNVKEFNQFWHKCAYQRGMYISLRREIIYVFKAFGKSAVILTAKHKGRLVSGIMILFSKGTSYYMYAASSHLGKQLFAPTLLAWEAIKLSRKKGYKYFDFEGIYDERYPIKSWRGFTRFKKSFGGMEVTYPPTLRKYFLPL